MMCRVVSGLVSPKFIRSNSVELLNVWVLLIGDLSWVVAQWSVKKPFDGGALNWQLERGRGGHAPQLIGFELRLGWSENFKADKRH